MQATLEAESKAKNEALRIKKKLEQDINVRFFCLLLGKKFKSCAYFLIKIQNQKAQKKSKKSKFDSHPQELEIALDHANKANADAQKNIKRYQEQVRELQLQVEDEQRQKDDLALVFFI